MASYQDIESRLRTVEDKIDFVMKAFTVTKKEPSIIQPGSFIIQTRDLLSIYQEAKSLGARLVSTKELNEEVEAGLAPELAPEKELSNG